MITLFLNFQEALAFSLSTMTKCHLKDDMETPNKLSLSIPDLQIAEVMDLATLHKLYEDKYNTLGSC